MPNDLKCLTLTSRALIRLLNLDWED